VDELGRQAPRGLARLVPGVGPPLRLRTRPEC
jgi:hypothetical protein